MSRKNRSPRTSTGRPREIQAGRSLKFETMEGRLVLSASGFAGNECAPELNDAALDALIPNQAMPAGSEIAFQFRASEIVSDQGVGASEISDIRFALDPNIGNRTNGATPAGATLSLNDQATPADQTDDTWDFSWTPSAEQTGSFRLFLIATDDGGTNNVPLSDVYSFALLVGDRPVVDLNGVDDDGVDFGPVSFREDDASVPISIVDNDLIIQTTSDMLASATVEITDPQAGGTELLAVNADNTLEVDTSTNGRLVVSVVGGGLAETSLFESALRSLTYNNTSDDPLVSRTIQVTVNDGTAESDAATTSVTIERTNDAPDLQSATDAPDAKIGEEYLLNLLATDPDSADLLVFRITSGPAGAVIAPNGLPDGSSDNTIQVSPGADGSYRAQISWTPSADQATGDAVLFTVSVTDTGGFADAEVYEIGIENQAPVAAADPSPGAAPLAVGEDDGETPIGNVLANDSDPENDAISVASVLVGEATFLTDVPFSHPTSGASIEVAAGGDVSYDPEGQFDSLGAQETATDTFRYTIIDENGAASGEAVVTVTINGENDAPTATTTVPAFRISSAAGATLLDQETLLTAVADVDSNDILTVAAAPENPAEGGLFVLDSGELSFDPNGDFSLASGAEETIDFLVTISDSAGEEVAAAAQIIVAGNVPPVAADDPDFEIDEDTLLFQASRAEGVLANDSDDGGIDGLDVSEVNGDQNNVANVVILTDGSGRTAELSVSPNGTFNFDPRENFDSLAFDTSSVLTFTYRAFDGVATSNEATATIAVNGVNDVPVANDVVGNAVAAGDPVDGNFDASDVDDGESSTLTYAITSQPSEGSVTNNGDGTFTFDPGADFQDLAEGLTRDVSFNYTATDAQDAISDAAIATFTVTGVANAPQVESVSPNIVVALADSEVIILFNKAMGDSATNVTNYLLRAEDGPFADIPILAQSATLEGDRTVRVAFSDANVDLISSNGTTEVTLVIDASIADVDGNVLEGDLEHPIDLIV